MVKYQQKMSTKEKIKLISRKLFNENDTLNISTNHIAKEAGISPGNLYYHYKNKEAIILDIYLDMHKHFVSLALFERVSQATNPLKTLLYVFDELDKLFWDYRFIMRESPILIAANEAFKNEFVKHQQLRIKQIEALLTTFLNNGILEGIKKEEIPLRAKLNWFISCYWQVFTDTNTEVSKSSFEEMRQVLFNLHLFPFLTEKGKDLLSVET